MGPSKVFLLILIVSGVKSWLLDLSSLSESEKVAIDQLREEMGGGGKLKWEYMEEDWYLSKWLSARDFNVSLAKQLLQENLKWREEHRIDKILEENWREMEEEFTVEKDSVDLEGRPILYLNFGKWDVHKLMTEEDSLVRLGRYLTKLVEEMDTLVRRKSTSGSTSGQSINQFNLIINFDGYDIWNQGCFQCLAFYKNFAATVETHYPRSIERVLMVNAPPRFELIYWYIEADLMEKTRKSMHLFGEDRGQWEPALLAFVGRDQVPGKLLQQKPRDVTPQEMGYYRPSDDITTRMTSGQV